MPDSAPKLPPHPLPGLRAGMLLAAQIVEGFELEHNAVYRRRLAQEIRHTLQEIEMAGGKMSQAGTTKGLKGESGEREPKGATSSDSSGEKKVGVPKADNTKGTRGQTGERIPKSTASDRTGEKSMRIAGGVGQGQHDALTGRDGGHAGKQDGKVGEFNTGRTESTSYRHKKDGY